MEATTIVTRGDRHTVAVRAKWNEARQQVKNFHHRLCTLRVLDPACGSANFLYVTLEHLKRLEGEVLNQLNALGETQDALDLGRETVNLQQLRGIELNERAAALAELVLWIGFLQWHIRSFGNSSVAEPVVHDYGNIEHRDAVLDYDSVEPMTDEVGATVMRWDGVTTKTHPATGQQVPDDAAQVVQWRYVNPRQAKWPAADFIVGNPPFIGAGAMRGALGEGYVDALRGAWPKVPESADFVMYWWHRAAEMVGAGQTRRSGLITTNSLRQTFNRRVVQLALEDGLSLMFAVPDHPWVDSANGAAVRIAMTVLGKTTSDGKLFSVTGEKSSEFGEVKVELGQRQGLIHSDLRIGANVAGAASMRANMDLSNRGVQLFGAGFIVTPQEAAGLGLGTVAGLDKHIRRYRNGRDLTSTPRDAMVIDMFGMAADDVRAKFPAAYQWLLERVKPERDQNNREGRRKNWWLFGETNPKLRRQLGDLPRYIVTVETAKHRVFQFLDCSVLPDNKLVAIALSDALNLGVLSSRVHGAWALAAGSWLGVGNDPVYVKSRCFEAFPFPGDDTGLTPALVDRIRSLAEQIDAHRKARQAAHSTVTITGMYNVLEKLRSGEQLNATERLVNENGLVSVLQSLHEELDAVVLEAYGWGDLSLPADTDALLLRLVELNTKRANEEAAGQVRWLRPEFQSGTGQGAQTAFAADSGEDNGESVPTPARAEIVPAPWATGLADQIKAVADVMAGAGRSLDLEGLSAHFTGRGRWRERLPTILDALVALGRLRLQGDRRWVDAAQK